MENLVGRKVLCTQSYDGVTKGKEYIITDVNNNGFYIIEDDGKKQNWCTSHLDSETHLKLLIDEPQFKQGNKVLVSNNRQEWYERIFVVKHNIYFYCQFKEKEADLLAWKYIKPYEEEIKIGDWVKSNDFITKYTKQMAGNWTKITNPQLIELLNNEL